MDEEDAKNITKREVEAFVCEVEWEHIHVDCKDDGESHCDKSHVDDDYKVKCELVSWVVTNEFGEVEIVNEHMHASISHHTVEENYVNENYGLIFEIGIDRGHM